MRNLPSWAKDPGPQRRLDSLTSQPCLAPLSPIHIYRNTNRTRNISATKPIRTLLYFNNHAAFFDLPFAQIEGVEIVVTFDHDQPFVGAYVGFPFTSYIMADFPP